LVFRHADGTTYGHVVHPRAAAIHEEAFRALRSLGFREGEARRALESVRASAPRGFQAFKALAACLPLASITTATDGDRGALDRRGVR
jgi:Holliday junction resolvasome RuvABC DNA-binding subunit